jgi:hypothetical protein
MVRNTRNTTKTEAQKGMPLSATGRPATHHRSLRLRFRRFSGTPWNVIVSEPNGSGERAVTEFVRKSGSRFDPSNIHRPLRVVFILVVLQLWASAGAHATKVAGMQNGTTLSSGPDLTIAIADFDGDRGLDLASVQTAGSASGSSTYWIQFQFSTAGQESVQLVAPPGGLAIEARDVNGDQTVDLIFTTAWLRQPVAILLNDGHGRFSRVEPAAFPAAFDQSRTNWVSGTRLRADFLALPPQSRIGMDHANKNPLHQGSQAGRIVLPTPEVQVAQVLCCSAGRAPPSAFTQL